MLKQKILFKLGATSKSFCSITKSNLIKFKQKQNGLTESDLISLFMGLLNLIKSNAKKNAELVFKKQINYYKGVLDISIKERLRLESKLKKLKQK